MEENLGRSCLILALLGILLAVAYAVSPNVRPGGTVAAQSIALQGGAVADDEASDDEPKVEQREAERPPRSLKQAIAFVLAGYTQPPEGKNFQAPDEIIATKPQE